MASFQGMAVQVTMREPPGTIIHGVVKDVIAGQTLTLRDVIFPANGARWDEWTVQGSAIADLQVMQSIPTSFAVPPTPVTATQTKAPPFPPSNPNVPQHHMHPSPYPNPQSNMQPPLQPSTQQSPATFTDPAILSYGKSPAKPASQLPPVPSTPIKSRLAQAAETLPVNTSPFVAEAEKPRVIQHAARGAAATSNRQASNARAFDPTQARNGANDEAQEQGQGDTAAKKKVRRGQKKKGTMTPVVTYDPPAVMNSEVSRNGNDMNGSVERGSGWRQTPLLQPSPQTLSPANATSSKKKNRKQREHDREVSQNGWATEDATDIQGLDDFDFEANHKLFDKKQVFHELRQGDTTADEDRLVSHNKVHRPGTYGGKNLHPTENVLSPKLQPKYLSNDLDSSSDTDTALNFANGRSSSKHSASHRKLPSRQNSTPYDSKSNPMAGSERATMARSLTSLSTRGPKNSSIAASSPRAPERTHSPQSVVSAARSAFPQTTVLREPHFVLQHTLTTCPLLHPVALETLENETVARFGLTHEAITESAARSISEGAMSMFDGFAGSRRESRANTIRGSVSASAHLDRTSLPAIVILAGNHAIGARAVAAARQLVGRETKIIVAEAQYESAETQDAQMRSQTNMLKRMMRGGARIKRGSWRRASAYIKNLSGPPAIIIDALLAGSTYDSLVESNAQLGAESQKEAREMIDWANRSRAPVLSVGCPSGVSGVDGSATIVDGEPLAVRPDKIICLGAPMPGLLEASKNGEKWDLTLADIGINIALRSEEAVAFGARWVAELKYVQEAEPVTDA